jgi:hypothetical protein
MTGLGLIGNYGWAAFGQKLTFESGTFRPEAVALSLSITGAISYRQSLRNN